MVNNLTDKHEIAKLENEIARLQREIDRLTWREHGSYRVCRHCRAVYPHHYRLCITRRQEKS